MTTTEALTELQAMPESDFQTFFKSLPARTQMMVRGGLADWREVLPQWYINTKNN